MPGGPHIWHTLAVNDERGDVPHHGKDAQGRTEQEHTYKRDAAKILRCKKKRRRAEMRCKIAGDSE